MRRLELDRSGTMDVETWFKFDVPLNSRYEEYLYLHDNEMAWECRPSPHWSQVPRVELDVACNVASSFEECYCPRKQAESETRHAMTLECGDEWISLIGTRPLGDLISGQVSGILVTERVAEKLAGSGLMGFDLVELEVESRALYPPDPEEMPKVFQVRPRGVFFIRPVVVEGEPPQCPHCGSDSLVCPDCGRVSYYCGQCDKQAIFTEEKKSKKRAIFANQEETKSPIYNGSRWDGGDFCFVEHRLLVTRRVLLFLDSIHATPYLFRPVPVWIDAMNAEQRQWRERARILPSADARE
ncbi:MAG: hypothetical protein U1D30_00285 [Planctomycetota bacterium]